MWSSSDLLYIVVWLGIRLLVAKSGHVSRTGLSSVVCTGCVTVRDMMEAVLAVKFRVVPDTILN